MYRKYKEACADQNEGVQSLHTADDNAENDAAKASSDGHQHPQGEGDSTAQEVLHQSGDENNEKHVVRQCWSIVEDQLRRPPAKATEPVSAQHTCNSVRIFVSSTFADCHSEREILVKQVFPLLEEWCSARQLHVIGCDLRWGVPRDSTTSNTIKICLEELDHCHQETGGEAFFLGIIGHRYGWIPDRELVSDEVGREYDWIPGMSVTTMEILHGAYRSKNPNAAFFMRDGEFLHDVPKDHIQRFQEKEQLAVEHLKMLKEKLLEQFPDQIFDYKCHVEGTDFSTLREKVKLGGLEDFAEKVLNFFKKAIERKFSDRMNIGQQTEHERETAAHHDVMTTKSQNVTGRDAELQQLMDYGTKDEVTAVAPPPDDMKKYVNEKEFQQLCEVHKCKIDSDVAMMCVTATSGLGKSSLLARLAADLLKVGVKVFYHNVGCTPSSFSGHNLLIRMLHFLQDPACTTGSDTLKLSQGLNESELRSKLIEAVDTYRKDSAGKPVVIIIDALNQLSSQKSVSHLDWLPAMWPPSVRCVVSSNTDDIPTMARIASRQPHWMTLTPLSTDICKAMAASFLKQFSKVLDADQMSMLTSRGSAGIPLWLTMACEELRVFGDFTTLNQKIESIPDDLLGLLTLIIQRLISEDATSYLTKLLGLISISRGGILERDIQGMLSYPSEEPVTMLTWALLRSTLRPFLSYVVGHTGHTAIQFFHQTVYKAVDSSFLMENERRDYHAHLVGYYGERCEPAAINYDQLLYHCYHAGLRTKLISYIRTDTRATTASRMGMHQLLQSMRCSQPATLPGVAGQQPSAIMLCAFCATRFRVLSPFHPAKDACVICGQVAMAMTSRDAHRCMKHRPFVAPKAHKCIGCGKMTLPPVKVTAARVCNWCSMGPKDRCCHLLTEVNNQ